MQPVGSVVQVLVDHLTPVLPHEVTRNCLLKITFDLYFHVTFFTTLFCCFSTVNLIFLRSQYI